MAPPKSSTPARGSGDLEGLVSSQVSRRDGRRPAGPPPEPSVLGHTFDEGEQEPQRQPDNELADQPARPRPADSEPHDKTESADQTEEQTDSVYDSPKTCTPGIPGSTRRKLHHSRSQRQQDKKNRRQVKNSVAEIRNHARIVPRTAAQIVGISRG